MDLNAIDRPPSYHEEEVPLRRLPIELNEKDAERRKIRQIFSQYDTDNDGKISLSELRVLIKSGNCKDINPRLARHVLSMSDEDGDGFLNFEEFYKMSKANPWIIREHVVKYCQMMIPQPVPRGDQVDTTLHDEVSWCPPPLTMVVFSAIAILTFLVDVIYLKGSTSHKEIGESTDGPMATYLIYNPFKRYELWRFFTYMFVHIGLSHLLWNMVIQILLGTALEVVHKWWRVAIIFLAGVLAGSMGTSFASPTIFLAGSSGGVYALITAHLATLILNWHEMRTAIGQTIFFVIYGSYDIFTSAYRHANDPYDRVGYVAHLSGAVAGLLVGFGILRNLKVRRWEKILWWISITVYSVLMVIGILIHIFYKSYFP